MVFSPLLQGVDIAFNAEPCISYGKMSVGLSVCLSHDGTVSKQRKLGSQNLY